MAVYTINTQSASPRPDPRKSSGGASRQLFASVIGVVILGITALVAWKMWPLPSPDSPPTTLVKFASSEQFAGLSDAKKQPYIDALMNVPPQDLFTAARDANLSQDERASAMENVMGARFQKSLGEYFALATPAERNAYLDKMIDEGEKRRAMWQARRQEEAATRPARAEGEGREGRRREGGGQGGGGAMGNWMSPERIKRRIENTPPVRRAQMAEFMGAMRARREARGLPSGPGPGGGGRAGGRGPR